jgi:hypothetical protein
MQYIASLLPPNTTSSLSDLPDGGMRLLIRGLSTTLGQDPDVVLKKLQRMKTAQDNNGEMMSGLHYLAKVFNKATGDIEDRQNEVRNDLKFMSFMKASGRDHTLETDCKAAIEAVMKTARAYDKTFWKNFAKLVAYIGAHPNDFVTIGDVDILVIDSSKNSEEYIALKEWMEVMNGYTAHMEITEHAYGLKAYKMMGSIEQQALAENCVCFNPVLYEEALVIAKTRKMSSNQVDLLSSLFD